MTASYVLVEGTEAGFGWRADESHFMRLRIRPRRVGNFRVYLRATLERSDGTHSRDPTGLSRVDQQGFSVLQKTIVVREEVAAGSIRVSALEHSGSPIEGTELNAFQLFRVGESSPLLEVDPTTHQHTFSDLEVGVPYRVDAYANDMLIGQISHTLQGSGVEEVAIHAPRRGTLEAVVLYSDGETGLAGVSVELRSHSQAIWRTGTSDADGIVRWGGSEPSTQVFPNRADIESWRLRAVESGVVLDEIELDIVAGERHLVGVVTDRPPPGITIEVHVSAADGSSYVPEGRIEGVLLDATGAEVARSGAGTSPWIRFDDVPLSDRWELLVFQGGIAIGRWTDLVGDCSEVEGGRECRLEAPRQVYVFVREAERARGLDSLDIVAFDPAGVEVASDRHGRSGLPYGDRGSVLRLFATDLLGGAEPSYRLEVRLGSAVVEERSITVDGGTFASNFASLVVPREAFAQACRSLGAHDLRRRRTPAFTPLTRRALILVHGYNSKHWHCGYAFFGRGTEGDRSGEWDEWSTDYFDVAGEEAPGWAEELPRLLEMGYEVWSYRWPTDLSILEAGERLAQQVAASFAADYHLVFYGHSMGGLVSRMAAAASGRPNVHVVTAGTPNAGSATATSWACDKLDLVGKRNCQSLSVDEIRPHSAAMLGFFESLVAAEELDASLLGQRGSATDHITAIAGDVRALPGHEKAWWYCQERVVPLPADTPCDGLIEVDHSLYTAPGSREIEHRIFEDPVGLPELDHGMLKLRAESTKWPIDELREAVRDVVQYPTDLSIADAAPPVNRPLRLSWTYGRPAAGAIVQVDTSPLFDSKRIRADTVRDAASEWEIDPGTRPAWRLDEGVTHYARVIPVRRFAQGGRRALLVGQPSTPVSFVPGPAETPLIAVQPAQPEPFRWVLGHPASDPSHLDLTVSLSGGPTAWTAALHDLSGPDGAPSPWLEVGATGGSSGSTVRVTPTGIEPTSSAGVYTGRLRISAAGATPVDVALSVDVLEPPVISVEGELGTVEFDGTDPAPAFGSIRIEVSSGVTWSATFQPTTSPASGPELWARVVPASGPTDRFATVIVDGVDHTSTAGSYGGEVVVAADGAAPVSVPVSLIVPTFGRLTVLGAGQGSGSVATPAGARRQVRCEVRAGTTDDECVVHPVDGEVVQLVAVAGGGSAFDGWSGACTAPSGPCSIGVSGSETVTARFVPASGDPLSVTSGELPNATLGAAYEQLLQATGGVSPYVWSVTDGSLPLGLTLTEGGTIGGVAEVSGTFEFRVQVLDSQSQAASADLSLTIRDPGAELEYVFVTPSAVGVRVGEAVALAARGVRTTGDTLSDLAFEWGSNDDVVARVDASGIVTALAPGFAYVVASLGGLRDSARVTVAPAEELSERVIFRADFDAYEVGAPPGPPRIGRWNELVTKPDSGWVLVRDRSADLADKPLEIAAGATPNGGASLAIARTSTEPDSGVWTLRWRGVISDAVGSEVTAAQVYVLSGDLERAITETVFLGDGRIQSLGTTFGHWTRGQSQRFAVVTDLDARRYGVVIDGALGGSIQSFFGPGGSIGGFYVLANAGSHTGHTVAIDDVFLEVATCEEWHVLRTLSSVQWNEELRLQLGDSVVAEPVVTESGGGPSWCTPAWRSSNSSVATVDDSGVVRAVGSGATFVTVSAGPHRDSARVVVGDESPVADTLLLEDFSGDFGGWILFGSPLSFIDTGTGNPAPALSVNGDASWDSGIMSRDSFSIGEGGLTVEWEQLRPDAAIPTHFTDIIVGLGTSTSGPTPHRDVNVGIQWQVNTDGQVSVWYNDQVQIPTGTRITDRRWVPFRIELDPDRTARFYADGVLVFTAPEPIAMAEPRPFLVTGRRHHVDNIRITAASGGSPVADVTIVPDSATIPVGDTLRLQATIRDVNGVVVGEERAAWSTLHASIVSVDSTGLVRALGPGSGLVVAAVGGVADTAAIVVTEPTTGDLAAWVGLEPLDGSASATEALRIATGDSLAATFWIDLSAAGASLGAAQTEVRFDPSVLEWTGAWSSDFSGTLDANFDSVGQGAVFVAGINPVAGANTDTVGFLRLRFRATENWGRATTVDWTILELSTTTFVELTDRVAARDGQVEVTPGEFSVEAVGDSIVSSDVSRPVALHARRDRLRVALRELQGRVHVAPAVARVDSITGGSGEGVLDADASMHGDSGFVRVSLAELSDDPEDGAALALIWLSAVGEDGERAFVD